MQKRQPKSKTDDTENVWYVQSESNKEREMRVEERSKKYGDREHENHSYIWASKWEKFGA